MLGHIFIKTPPSARSRPHTSAPAAIILLCLALASCNRTDALIPPMDIGVTGSTSPMTQSDLDRASQVADAYQAAPQTSYNNPVYSAPQNTLQAQAKSLNDGAQYAEPAQQTLKAPQETYSKASDETSAPITETASLSTTQANGSVRFMPIIGAPVNAVTPLSRQLGAEARDRGITIRASNDTNTDNILKGYLSAFEDGDKVNIVYVWDILDNEGARLHRLQGQKSVASKGGDPWSSVNDAVMQAIANSTMNDYIVWKQANKL